jgi:hypothetical protein
MGFNEHYEKRQPSIHVTGDLVFNATVLSIEFLKHAALRTSTEQTMQPDLGFKAR